MSIDRVGGHPTQEYRRGPRVPYCAFCGRGGMKPGSLRRRSDGRGASGRRHLDMLKWGSLPHWAKEPIRAQRPINARSETAAKSGMARGALSQRRCIVPADAFYEWKVVEGGKHPYAIARQDGQPMAFAGLWESFRWPDETVTRSFTIMTTTPNAEMSELHDRMPVILDQQDWPTWLGEIEGDSAALLCPAADGLLRVWPVDRRVGSPRNNGPELLETIAA
jgi:putative SOS response-associated peptidase YedK